MTPSSNILHVLAEQADTFGVTVVHPENEVAVMLWRLVPPAPGRGVQREHLAVVSA